MVVWVKICLPAAQDPTKIGLNKESRGWYFQVSLIAQEYQPGLFLSFCCTVFSSWSRDGCKAPGISSSQAEGNHRKGSLLSHSWTTFSLVHWPELDHSQTMSVNQWACPNWLQPMKLPQLTLQISSVDCLKKSEAGIAFGRAIEGSAIVILLSFFLKNMQRITL